MYINNLIQSHTLTCGDCLQYMNVSMNEYMNVVAAAYQMVREEVRVDSVVVQKYLIITCPTLPAVTSAEPSW